MHIPDGYLGPQTYAVLDVAIIPIWAVAASKVKKTLKTKQVPLMALGAAFSFVIMMFNVPGRRRVNGPCRRRHAHRDHSRALGSVYLGVDRARHPGAAVRRRRHHGHRRQRASTWRS